MTNAYAAVTVRRLPPEVFNHTDPSAQYATESYRRESAANSLVGSTGQSYDPYDNAQAESLAKTLKCEKVYPGDRHSFD